MPESKDISTADAAMETMPLEDAITSLKGAIAEAKTKGVDARIGLYAELEELEEGIGSLLTSDVERPDRKLLMFSRRLVELLVGRFEEGAGDALRYLLTDTTEPHLLAMAQVCIEDARGLTQQPMKHIFELLRRAVIDASAGGGAEKTVRNMFEEARNGQR